MPPCETRSFLVAGNPAGYDRAMRLYCALLAVSMAADAGATSRRQASEPRQASPKAVRAAGADVGEPIDLDVDARTEPIAPVITLTAGEPLQITPQQVRRQIAVIEECQRQNPHIYRK